MLMMLFARKISLPTFSNNRAQSSVLARRAADGTATQSGDEKGEIREKDSGSSRRKPQREIRSVVFPNLCKDSVERGAGTVKAVSARRLLAN